MGQSWLTSSPSCHSFPPKKSSCYLCTKTVVSDPRLPAFQLRGPVATVQQPPAPTPHSQRRLVLHQRPRNSVGGLGQHGQGWEAPSPFPRNIQEARADLPRAQPHNDRKPFTFSKNTGPKVRTPQLLLLCQPNLRKRKKSVRNLIHLIWLHFIC